MVTFWKLTSITKPPFVHANTDRASLSKLSLRFFSDTETRKINVQFKSGTLHFSESEADTDVRLDGTTSCRLVFRGGWSRWPAGL